MSDYLYDAFISYKSEDAAWASLLRQRLKARELNVYQDVELRGGEQWLPQLRVALEQSRHLLVVWSKRTAASNGWVMKEMYHFEYQCRAKATAQDPRRIVIVHLDNQQPPAGFAELHGRNDLRKWGEQDCDVQSVTTEVWDNLTAKLHTDLTESTGYIEVPTVIFASRRAYFEKVDLDAPLSLGKPLTAVLRDLGLSESSTAKEFASFLGRYGDSREDWRPFGTNEPTVADLLVAVQSEVNESLRRVARTPIKLTPVDASFWSSDVKAVERTSRSLATRPALIVIDPLSLCDADIRDRVALLRDSLRNSAAAAILLGPIGMGGRAVALSEHVRSVARDIYEHFYDPVQSSVAGISFSAANVSDASQIKRCLLLALGHGGQSSGHSIAVPLLAHKS